MDKMTNAQVALMAAVEHLGNKTSSGSPETVTRVAGRFLTWLENSSE